MPKEFINPNLHVILIHYPLGLLVVGTLIELFAFLGWRRSAFRAAGRWMLLIGILSLGPVMMSGLYALADVNRSSETPDDATWIESRAMSPIQGEAWEFMTRHAWSNAIGSVVLLITMVLWMGSSDAWRRKLHLVWLLLVLGGLGTLIFGAWYGGEMVYRHGVGVEVVRETESGTKPDDGSGSGSPAIIEQTDIKERTAYYVPPLQTHVILAGATISLALAALGVSLRAGAKRDVAVATTTFDVAPEQTGIASALNPSLARTTDTADDYVPELDGPRAAGRARTAGGRFWLISAILAIGTSLSGLWTLAYFSDVWDVNELWQLIADTETLGKRRLAHVITGGGIIVLLLLLAVIARVARGRRFVVLLFTTLLVVAVVAQIWFGSLLMFDTPMGPLGSFNGTQAAMESSSEPSSEPSAEPEESPTTAPEKTAAPEKTPAPENPSTAPVVPAPATTTTTTAPAPAP